MKKSYLILAIFIVLYQSSFAQFKSVNSSAAGNNLITYNNTSEAYDPFVRSPFQLPQNILAGNTHRVAAAQGQGTADPTTGTEYDVKYYRIELRINPDTAVGNYVKGKVTTYFKTVQANFKNINFDMVSNLACDSVYYHGVKVAAGNVTRPSADILKITIPNIAATGTLDSVSVFYKGAPPAVPGMAGTGYVTTTHGSGASKKNYVYTLSEPYSSYTWWPCKSYIVGDKADSMDMIVHTPLNLKTASNGKLISETTSGTTLITHWQERYPISSYQVCVAVANFVQYPTVADTVVMGSDRMPVFNYIFPETNTAAAHTALDRVPLMITTFNSLYGDYPFKKEKYGNYSFGFGGGMEHNTFSGESVTGVYNNADNWDILAHELGHQWWGDNVTCASWSDIWLHESFADFSEALCIEFAPSIATSVSQTALAWRTMKKNNSTSASYQAKTTYVYDTTDILTIFTPSVYIYDRGGMIITMLRTLMGDTKFFQALKNYQSDPLIKMGNGLTADVKRHMEAASGLDLTTFFNQWFYNTGYAKYTTAQWNNIANNISIKLVQTPQSSSLSHFDMPVAVRIQGSNTTTMDTTVIIYDQGGTLYYDQNGLLTNTGSNIINFKLSFTPVTLTMDAFSQTMATGTFAKNTGIPVTVSVLATQVLTFTGNKDGNAAKLYWSVDKAADLASFDVERSTDGTTFKNIGTLNANNYPGQSSFTFTDNNLQDGNNYYRIKITQKDGSVIYTKIVVINNKANDTYFTITPNPARDYITITGNTGNTQGVDIKIFDATGRLVKNIMKQSLSNSSLKIPVNELGTGSYFVEIISANTNVYTKQVSIIR